MTETKEHPPERSLYEFTAFLGALSDSLKDVDEVQPALDLATRTPSYAHDVFNAYTAIARRMAHLDQYQLARIRRSWQRLENIDADVRSASKTNASDICSALGDETQIHLAGAADKATDLKNPMVVAAIEDLTTMMTNGSRLKAEGREPRDGDPEFDAAIWGHTQLTDHEVLYNFLVCHYLERYFSQVLRATPLAETAEKKDFFLNAIGDVMLLDATNTRSFTSLLDLWMKPRAEGGLGWIDQTRVDSYSNVTGTQIDSLDG